MPPIHTDFSGVNAAEEILPEVAVLTIRRRGLEQMERARELDAKDLREGLTEEEVAEMHRCFQTLESDIGEAADAYSRGSTIREFGGDTPILAGERGTIRLTRRAIEDYRDRRARNIRVTGPDNASDADRAAYRDEHPADPYESSKRRYARYQGIRADLAAADDIDMYRTDPERYADKRAVDWKKGRPEVFAVAAARALSGEDPDALRTLAEDREGSGTTVYGGPHATPFTRDEAAALEHATTTAGASMDRTGVTDLLPSTAVVPVPTAAEVGEKVNRILADRDAGTIDNAGAAEQLVRMIPCDADEDASLEETFGFHLDDIDAAQDAEQRSLALGALSRELDAQIPMITDAGERNTAAQRLNADGTPIREVGDRSVPADDGRSAIEQEVGYGDVMADDRGVYRMNREKGTWQRRTRDPRSGKVNIATSSWRPVAGPGPSAVKVSSSVVADAMGGRCINCGKPLKDSTRHGGYGPECVKKVAR